MTATPAGITYAQYLGLDDLLSAQRPLSGLHDEMLFIVIHQTMELWMKEMLHEVDYAIGLIGKDSFAPAYKALSRVGRIQSVMTLSWDVLSTLTPVDYLAFRDVLGTSSGFQSAQFRELEYRLGLKDEAYLKQHAPGSEDRRRLDQALLQPSLRDAAAQALERAGFDVSGGTSAAWLEVYRRADDYFELYQLAEKLLDLDDAMAMWRHKHVLTVERIIGNKRGTGGSSGASYLRSTLDKRLFPELWALRTDL